MIQVPLTYYHKKEINLSIYISKTEIFWNSLYGENAGYPGINRTTGVIVSNAQGTIVRFEI